MHSEKRGHRTIVLRNADIKTYAATSAASTEASTPIVASVVSNFSKNNIAMPSSQIEPNFNPYAEGSVDFLERENMLLRSEVRELKSVNRQLLQTCQQLKLFSKH